MCDSKGKRNSKDFFFFWIIILFSSGAQLLPKIKKLSQNSTFEEGNMGKLHTEDQYILGAIVESLDVRATRLQVFLHTFS